MVEVMGTVVVPRITGVSIQKGSRVRLTATVTNVGNAPGYFKVFGYLYNASGPTGSSGYNVGGWDKVASYVTDNTKGVGFDSSWTQIQAGGSYTFQVTSSAAVNWTGSAHLWIVVAVSTSSTGSPRLYANEYYYFAPNTASITAPVQLPGTPGTPYKVGQQCNPDGTADVTIAWSPASGTERYRVYHISGSLYGETASTQFTVRGVYARSPSSFTVYVEACNSAGCTRGPSGTISVSTCQTTPTCPTPPNPTPIRSYFEGLGCTVRYVAGPPEQVIVSYGGKSYTFTRGVDCWYSGNTLVTSPSTALSAARSLGVCA